MRHTIKNTHHLTNVASSLSHWQRWLLTLSFIIFHFSFSVAQDPNPIVIGGNVYGGGNKGTVGGNTTVTVKAVSQVNDVYAGARQSNVGGRAFVHIDGEEATGDIFITNVYGGNDIAGSIGSSTVPVATYYTAEEATAYNTAHGLNEGNPGYKSAGDLKTSGLTEVLQTGETKETHPEKNAIDDSWNAFVRTSRSTQEVDGPESSKITIEDKWILVGSLYGGGNGEYYYHPVKETTTGTGTEAVTTVTYDVYLSQADYAENPVTKRIATITRPKGESPEPALGKTYLEIKGGELAHVYGGGNNATVTENTTICINNSSDDCQKFITGYAEFNDGISEDMVKAKLQNMAKLSTFQSKITNFKFNHARVFGGNNKTDMAIRPTWNLQQGLIRDLYSGGNEGRMTSPDGLLLEINPIAANNDKLSVSNVYGGCRRADVRPLDASGNDVTVGTLSVYNFPTGLPARTMIRGGQITNVYGGNDISGKVYGGNAVGIHTSILGDVYGGGNGSYAYTDNPTLGAMDTYRDFYYDVNKILGKAAGSSFTELESAQALNMFRPNAEQVSIRLKGYPHPTGQGRPNFTIIKGSVYCGGNSASMGTIENPLMEIKFGSHVIANNVFLGNNGENMVDTDILKLYAGSVENGKVMEGTDGTLLTGGDGDYSSLELTGVSIFAEYMDGVVMDKLPSVVFDGDGNNDSESYTDNTSYVGSFYCGGNVGSMAIPGSNSYRINRGLNIFDKFVGGCQSADIEEDTYNAAYEGGVLGAKNERGTHGNDYYTSDGTESSNIKDRIEINLENLTIMPLRWKDDTKSEIIWNTNRWYDYAPIESGTVLNEGDKYYTYNSTTKEYSEQTVSGESITANGSQYEELYDFLPVENSEAYSENEKTRNSVRLLGGNVYGGCYNSGHVNGNVVINIKEDVLNKDAVFGTGPGLYGNKASGVVLENQRDDEQCVAMSVFGAGYGEDTEIWGSTTVNLNKGYTFQIFGGGEQGVVGKGETKTRTVKDKDGNDVTETYRDYTYDPRYSSTVNLNGRPAATATSNDGAVTDLAETEYIYGGGSEGDVSGNTYVYLGNGRIYDAFGGASDADILGHTEVYIGRQPDGNGGYKEGFPWIRDIVYGGNDFGGTIHGEGSYDFTHRIEDYSTKKAMIHGYEEGKIPDVLKATTYVEYLKGRVDTIFGGGYGYYNYSNIKKYGEGCSTPVQKSSFVNIRPTDNDLNAILGVFGGGTGYPNQRSGDQAQDRSYVLVDIPDGITSFKDMEIFGSGSYNGLGMRFTPSDTYENSFSPDQLSAIVDLLHGQIGNVYGGSYNEGVTARTVINVPTVTANGVTQSSTIKVKNIFGGAYGTQILPPCDVYESNVNYNSNDAFVSGSLYGGNNNERRTLYAKLNIKSAVRHPDHWTGVSTVYGAGKGIDTWSEYTEVNLESGAKVREVYGGGELGHVLNAESVQTYMELYKDGPSDQIAKDDPFWKDASKWTLTNGKRIPNTPELKKKWAADWADAWTLGKYYTPDKTIEQGEVTDYDYSKYASNHDTNLTNEALVTVDAEMDDRDYSAYAYTASDTQADKDAKDNAKNRVFKRYNTNVKIKEGAEVVRYAYGGGWGTSDVALSGDVYGTTYIALLGGTVGADIYAAGTSGAVHDLFGKRHFSTSNLNGFTASANAFILGGTVRNVYGGGWEGNVGHHNGTIAADHSNDILGETHVVIGDVNGTSLTNGIPAIQRNAYGGGEGGAVFGTANITLNNGYIGYQYLQANQKFDDEGKVVTADASEGLQARYEEKIIDETKKDEQTGAFVPNRNLEKAGCMFGGGYVDNSSVDRTNVLVYGGNVRNSVFGGGEIAAIGRGTIEQTTDGENKIRTLSGLYYPGKTHLEMYGGHVHRNVFGGGRGYDNLGGYGTLHTEGCVFGQTEVHVHGGEIGSAERLDYGDGNVFGGGDIGCVYSAYVNEDGSFGKGVKSGVRYNQGLSETDPDYNYQGYYYQHKWNGTADADFITVKTGEVDDGNGGTTEVYERQFTEDCKVLIEPHCKSTSELSFTGITYPEGITVPSIDYEYLKANDATNFAKIGTDGKVKADNVITFSRSYPTGSFIPIAALNTLGKKNSDNRWSSIDSEGITIHNAVFAGGNTPSGKSATNADTPSVFGNATASINDVYHRDLIMLGTRHTGGLYGDGNLTLVDGYRELNITNYGTDYYGIQKEITISQYEALPKREADYYELRYTCEENCTDREGTTYKKSTTENNTTSKASTITADELLTLFLTEQKDAQGNIIYYEGTQTPKMKSIQCPYPANSTTKVDVLTEDQTTHEWKPTINPSTDKPYFWKESGVLPVYAGRLMNSIQRADFCGVWGSRMVLQGARDRVTNEPTNTNYTINRVRELSLNKKNSVISADANTDAAFHGNYFGIYNIVNYLGALTSDVDFETAYRKTDNDNYEVYGPDIDPSKVTITATDLAISTLQALNLEGISWSGHTVTANSANALYQLRSQSIDGITITVSGTISTTTDGQTYLNNNTIEGVTISDESFTAESLEAYYRLRALASKGITITTPIELTNQTYAQWKGLHHNERKRNNGKSHNQVALASGVYLELTTEESTGPDLYEKEWGPITGVIELDLINVQPGIGGGFVYAKNVHGVRSTTGHQNTTLTALNNHAVTQWDFDYTDPVSNEGDQKEWETSGNFVHSTQTIIDDCYNVSNRYAGASRVPAHYWYIKGSVYVYDQYISAYTGSPNAFSREVDIPLTITAASHGTMKLLDVKPNRYAYYSSPGVKLEADKKISINDKTYNLNDPISYWDWYLLPASERALFIENTYVNCVAVNIDNAEKDGEPLVYEAGTYVMTESEYNGFGNSHTYKDANGEIIKDADDNAAGKSYIFRPSNNLSHDTGYILTYQVNNPGAWDTWYTPKTGYSFTGKKTLKVYQDMGSDEKENYEDGPTYHLDQYQLEAGAEGAVLGQRYYEVGNLISWNTYDTYSKITSTLPADQATFEQAYLVTDEASITETDENGQSVVRHLNPGATLPSSKTTGITDKVDKAYICTKTIEVDEESLIYRDSKMTKTKRQEKYIDPLYTEIRKILPTIDDERLEKIRKIEDLTAEEQTALNLTEAQKAALKPLLALKNEYSDYLVPAYYCTVKGNYGGNYYKKEQNYRGLEAWSSMSEADRSKFVFNYDALDLLIDPTYGVTKTSTGQTLQPEGKKYQYDGQCYDEVAEQWKPFATKDKAEANPAKYSLERSLDYTATYNGSDVLTYTADNGTSTTTTARKELTSTEYEQLPNEQRHYVALHVKDGKLTTGTGDAAVYNLYVVHHAFQMGNTPYAVGTSIDEDTYLSLADRSNITKLTFPASEKDNVYYYCWESYQVGTTASNGPGTEVTHAAVTGSQGYNEDGESVAIKTAAYAANEEVPIGLLINKTTYDVISGKNRQKNFTFHGISPTETSTLYVSKESDIYDLSKDKIITVIYKYDYEESDAYGNVTPVSERHVLNIHIKFESGIPVVDDITPPDIILPGNRIDIGEPDVKPGAYEVMGGGWELFENSRDAESHSNGVDYDPTDPKKSLLYWYQHDWYVAYYAKTYLGRTYSNAVPVRVANYHDLADVMSDANKEHHMYIDHTGVKRDPKIYINDYSKSGKNGLDLFKDLFDLSVLDGSAADGYTFADGKITSVTGTGNSHLKDHHLLGSQTRAGRNLEFFLRTDIDHGPTTEPNPAHASDQTQPETITVEHPWTPIGYNGVSDNPATPNVDEALSGTSKGECFDGVFHGDGHTISGLDHSLFNYLCGEVYNLGVQGTFTGAGIAEQGGGYVESCWVKSSAEELPSGGSKTNAVFGNPSDATGYQVVNSYFWDGNKALYNINTDETTSGGDRGKATAKPTKAFYNGELAYDLNNFYLYKRYANKMGTVDDTNRDDRYFTIGDDDELTLQPYRTYVNDPTLCSSGYTYTPVGATAPVTLKYVESRFANEDFRYAGGTIPTTKDDRYYSETDKDENGNDKEAVGYYPIWPDDYLFFGQKLTYGYSATDAHDEVPTAIAKVNGRLAQDDKANRVYRAPAYYRSSTMKSVYFNPDVYLAQKEKLSAEQMAANEAFLKNSQPEKVIQPRDVYPGMTAIDFAGHNGANVANGTYGLGSVSESNGSPAGATWFYPPLLDDDGLKSIINCDETQNLLVYAPQATTTKADEYANAKTYEVLNGYFVEPDYNTYYKDPNGYRIVEEVNTSSVHGHLVQNDKTATNDHLLVDKQDFNAPIAYTFASDRRMWYQRTPENGEYVEPEWTGTPAVRSTKGWQGVSLPFTAELVTTDDKGEITHFYGGSETSKNSDKKIGHEYWLREFDKIDGIEVNTVTANLTYPMASGEDKRYSNTFLWDYYYQNTAVHNHQDKNNDTYQTYYEKAHTHKNYPLLQAKTPYVIGFPGETYYEFDLSGKFEAQNTAVAINRLEKQTITFASKTGVSIGVSDQEMGGVKNTYNGKDYIFKPSYMNEEMEAGTFVLNSSGNAYTELSADATTNTTNKVKTSQYAFRPYFVTAAATGDGSRVTRSIVFTNDADELGEDQDHRADKPGTLNAHAGRRVIAVSSTMSEVVSVRILNTAGQTLAEFDIQPGETIETRVNISGVYVVQSADGHFTKKLSVR